MNRRGALALGLAFCAAPNGALADRRASVVGVDMRVSNIVASRIRTDLPGRIAGILRARGGAGRPVRVVVELRTIDPYRAFQPNVRRGIAVRYTVIDAATGRTLKASRFIQRTRPREDDRGTAVFGIRPITQGTQERELARGVANQIAREAL